LIHIVLHVRYHSIWYTLCCMYGITAFDTHCAACMVSQHLIHTVLHVRYQSIWYTFTNPYIFPFK